MKILSIRIKNLASLAGEHFIDFESEPLASAGLVAIVGKTGAGKSTILDAMCLALFNRVPRLKDSDGKLVDVDGSELPTNSPQTVLRRGTGHGFAELSFIAQDQKVYLARWEIKRAREKADGKLQSVQRSLQCLTDGTIIANKPDPVKKEILRITQLSFEQFTRAVLLAQSEVTAFLKARDNERGELLEYLTNSNIFAKIGKLAFDKTKEIASQRKELENVLGHIEILSEEDFATISDQFNTVSTEYKKLEIEKSALEKNQQWYEQKQKYETDALVHQQQLNIQQQQLDALAPEKAQLSQLERFAAIRPSVQRHKSIQNEIEQLKTPLQKAQHDFNHIEQQYTAEKIVFENIEAEQKQQNQFEIQHQDSIKLIRERIAERLVLVDQLRKAQSDFKEIENQLTPHLNHENQLKLQLEQLKNKIAQHTAQLECSKHFASIDDGLSAHLSQLQRFIQSYAQFEKTYGDVQHANLQCKAQQKQLDELTQQFGQDEVLHQKITSLRNERDQLLQQFSQFKVIQPQWQNFKHIDAEQRQLIDSYNTLNQQILEHQATFDSAEKDYQEQKIAREQLQKILQQQRLLNTENLEKLRSELVDGEACLVCGSTHHPYVEQANFSDELLKLQEQQEQQAVASEKLAFDTWQKQQTVLTELRASLNANQQHRANLGLQQQALQAELESQLTSLNIKFDFSQAHEALTQLLETQNHTMLQAQKQLEDSLASHEKVQKLRQTLATSIQHTTQHLSNVQQAENNIQHIISLLNDSEKYDWQQATLKTAEQIYHGLQQRQQTSKQLHDLTTQYNQTQQQFEQCTQQVKFSQEKIQSAEKAIEALKISGKKNTDIAIQAILDMTQITVEKPHEWLAEFEQQILQLKDKIELARQQFNQVRQSFDNAQSILNKCLTENTQLHKQAEQSNVQIQQWLEQNTEFNHALLEQLSTVSHEQEQQLKQRISAVERTYADLQAGIKTVQNQLKEHLAHQPNIAFEVLTSTLSALAENLRTLAEQRDELKLKLEVHQRNLAKQQQFAEQIQQIQTEEHRWNKISSLMGDATGKKFRDLAQQYNLDILIEYANQQLAMLSQRYTLKRLENSLSLAIVDHDMDGETRSVSSLSGGESFLTALALSLAIASMASGTTKIESLFIDEGFGTLDASSLHMVMNALDQLQHQGRKVVLISHIQEMHERIPVQIQVNPMGAGASTIQVVS
ncbi:MULTISPECIES: AAA family ATPase [Acinetobacter]|uniref:ATP-dependent dsDNA exonuclease n=1 Tax=Acinetobacter chengduensis TaxID=2420890 RepID=A0ABX9TZ28_9GAMM|nr:MULTISPECIES: AAA family ATPase [Acinetobacter]MBI1451225.1 AAA family ATPase [Acinetobacter sp. FL51]RKG43687.1 ATP-dependent dsDNA exonuclease [Acinetobacter sp. WCHAc060007]RLL23911.1 ATP-dependent dsDNA exonuclease [Acinetobacter chengduensis]